ncbi:MAG: hypothetical protein KC431_27090, partial [Myxococcales bacterium]|nr:hypothetical protein [Myxococcales bacterium]
NLAGNFFRGLAVIVVAVLPPLVTFMRLDGPLALALVIPMSLVGIALMPAAALACQANQSALAAFMPHLWFRIIDALRRDYAVIVAVFMALMIVQSVGAWMLMWILQMPVIASLLEAPFSCLCTFAMATSLGGVARRGLGGLG